jgi:hypothetical protein
MSNRTDRLPIVCAVLLVAAGVQPVRAAGGAGPPGWTMPLNYCRETVTNKGVTDVTKFEAEVKKCFADPVHYPPAYDKPRW